MTPFSHTARVDLRAAPPLATGLNTLTVVHEAIAPATLYPIRTLEMTAILATVSGSASVWDTHQWHDHRKGSLVVMPRGVRFEERVHRRIGWQVCYLMLSGPWVTGLERAIWRSRRRTILGLAQAPAAWHSAVVDVVKLALRQPRCWSWRAAAQLLDLFAGLCDRQAPESSPAGLLEQLQLLVDHDPAQVCSVKQAAAALGVSTSTLSHRFSDLTGRPVSDWMRSRRVDLARRLLDQGLAVHAVADRLGFANPFHFSRVFKRYAGVSPSELRRRTPNPLHDRPV